MSPRYLLTGFALLVGACTSSARPLATAGTQQVEGACSTREASLSFDFAGASASRCVIEGEREFSVLVTPEHQLPINPSPWYAFRYEASAGSELTVHLHYLGSEHRYVPIWSDGNSTRHLQVEVSPDGSSATMVLPAGKARVSAQEIIDSDHYRKALKRWASAHNSEYFALGYSHDRREIGAVRIGQANAPQLIILIGRQHPPEVTGAIAMEAFVDQIARMVADAPKLGERYQFMVIPMLNPDGVAHGNWRANRGGKDLNRDWGEFSQPETQAVQRWLNSLPDRVRPVLMLDFHSTYHNLFYVQGEEASELQERFLSAWLKGKEDVFPAYPFTIERRNANPGSGTTKNWFHDTYGIPAFTYEVADDADREGARSAARALAESLPAALEESDGA